MKNRRRKSTFHYALNIKNLKFALFIIKLTQNSLFKKKIILSLTFAVFEKNVENGTSGLFQPKYTKKAFQSFNIPNFLRFLII